MIIRFILRGNSPGPLFFCFSEMWWPWPCEMVGRKFQRLFFVQNPAPWKKQLIHVHQHVYIYIFIDLLLFFSCLFEVIHFSIKVPSCRDPQLVPRSWRIATAASPSWAESSERRSVGTFSADGSDRSNDRSAFVGRVNSRWATSLLSYKWSDMVNPYKSRKIIGLGEQKSYNIGAPCPFYL